MSNNVPFKGMIEDLLRYFCPLKIKKVRAFKLSVKRVLPLLFFRACSKVLENFR